MKRTLWTWTLAIVASADLLTMVACDDEKTEADTTVDTVVDSTVDTVADTTPDTEPDTTEDTTVTTYVVSGSVGRLVDTCPPLFGGIGTLCVHLLTSCTEMSSEVATAHVASADMSIPTNTVDWLFDEVPDGSYQVYAYHDDDDSGCDGVLTTGDFYSGDGCTAVTVAGADVTGVTITFNNKY